MAAGQAHLLPSDLSPSKRCVTVRARVVRVWEFTKNEFMHLDIVLIDEKGDKMYGEVAALHADKFREQLTEGNVFLIKDFFVQQSKNMYKAVEGEFMIKLTPRSKVEVQQNVPADFPRYTYSLSDFQILPILIRHTDSFIGLLKVRLPSKSQESDKRNLQITDIDGNIMDVALWGELCAISDDDTWYLYVPIS